MWRYPILSAYSTAFWVIGPGGDWYTPRPRRGIMTPLLSLANGSIVACTVPMGLSRILGFAGNESRHVNSRCAFPAADVFVNFLIEEAVISSPALFTGHLSRLVSGLERGLLHRSIAHQRSPYLSTMSPLKSSSSHSLDRPEVQDGCHD